jgi:hypothetical protein
MDFKEEWLLPGAVVTVDAETTQALVGQIHRLIRLVGSIKLEQSLQPPADEPVAWMMTNAVGKPYFRKKPQDKVFNPQPVYTSPETHKPWFGLTPEDYDSMRPRVPYVVNDFSFADVAAIVEAKLKEKNYEHIN